MILSFLSRDRRDEYARKLALQRLREKMMRCNKDNIKCSDCKHRVWDYWRWWCLPRGKAHPENKGLWVFCIHAEKKKEE